MIQLPKATMRKLLAACILASLLVSLVIAQQPRRKAELPDITGTGGSNWSAFTRPVRWKPPSKAIFDYNRLGLLASGSMQLIAPIRFIEADGSPSLTQPSKLVWPNGSLTKSGSTLTISFAGAGLISGSGTAGTLPKFTAAQTIGNSLISESGSNITVNGVLLPNAAGTRDFGSATLPYATIYFAGTSGTPGTNNFQFTGASTSGTRVVTFPDAATKIPIITQVLTFTGPSAARTFTFPDASATVLTTNDLVTVAQGGTGAATFTSNGVLYGNGTGALQVTAQGAANSVLTANAGAPVFSATPRVDQIGVGAATVAGRIIYGTQTVTATSGTTYTDYAQAALTPASNSSTVVESYHADLSVGPTGTATNTGTNVGVFSDTRSTGTGSGNISTLRGFSTTAYSNSSANNVSTIIGLNSRVGTASTGTATNAYGAFVDPFKSSTGAITNFYGLYVNPVNIADTLNYSIFTNAGQVRFGGDVSVVQGTITASAPMLNHTATWNSGGTTFTNMFSNVTDTASAAGSLLFDFQVGGASKANLTKAGALTLATALTVANGGTGITSGTSGGVPYFSGATTIASSAALAANQIVLGGGAGVSPATLGSLGTTTTVLHGNAAGAPTFGAVSLTTDVTGTLPVANGGTGATTLTANGILYGNGTGVIQALANATNGQIPIGSTGAAPVLATLTAGAGVSVTNGAGTITLASTNLFAEQSSDEEVTTTTLASSANLTVTLAASTTYEIHAVLFHLNDGASEGFKVALSGTVGVSRLKAQISIMDDTTNALGTTARVTALDSAVGLTALTGSNYTTIDGSITTSTSGTLVIQFAQNATGTNQGVHLETASTLAARVR